VKKTLARLAILMAVLFVPPAVAVIETYEFSDPQLEQRYRELSTELRCPKCQNQNIADSNAPIAQDLRKLLYQQLEAGASDGEILDYMVARYGEFVRYRPRFDGVTAVLWLAPALLLVIGMVVVVLTLRNRRDAGASANAVMSDEERERLRALIGKTEQGE